MFGFGKKPASPEGTGNGTAPPAPDETASTPAQDDPPATPGPGVALPKRPSTLSAMTDRLLNQSGKATPPDTSALNSQIVQAVQLSNAETASYAPSQIATAPDMMISQASALVAQSAANYFDGVSKIALASQAVLLKQMTENIAENKLAQAAEDALGALATDLLMGAAAAVAAAAGALEAESASFAIDKIDQSIAKYADTLANRNGKTTPPAGGDAS
ncbi:hypothetical protein [Pseudomonas indica]|uniref:Killing trait domain-containing protein n=1 Tax=Pseudomonas indica TaxID=137658 RepID=A0A1G9CZE3_9PSED|nr:hypothetical protein [Pseudomonas indica]MBU3056650.1 hypothetical protein [Pseudomonas indica]SDK57047.1 hypothetical protein SAMN05216186_10897 [Pseudomonas indica]